MKISKNILIKYLFILSLLWSFLLLEPILLQSYTTFTVTFATLGITIFMKGIGLSAFTTSQIGGFAFLSVT
ncbi:MAG: hypothetical protein ACTSSG_14350, partial [Candidatus Heimdallarchaeaceae archaeon]